MFILRHTENMNADNVERVRFLGVILDQKLTFKHHVNNISRKITSGIFVLRNISKSVDAKVCLMTYHALVHTVCVYGLLA